MSRCRETDALLDATFAGIDLTRAQVAHAAHCAECARALAHVHRFDNELSRLGLDLSPEPMPAPIALADPTTWSVQGGRMMTLRRGVLGSAVVALLLGGVVFGGGQWLGNLFHGRMVPAGVSAADLESWLDRALYVALEKTGRGGLPADWEPYQAEVCGASAIAFFVERDPSSVRPFRWAIGQAAGTPSVAATGIAGSLMDADVARARARLSLCSVFVDPSLGEAAARDAIARARDRWEGGEIPTDRFLDLRGAEVVDVSPMTRNLYSVLLERPDGARTWLERVSLSLDEDQLQTMSGGALDSGVTRPQVVYRDNTPTHYFGLIDDPSIVALELLGADERLRYTVGAPGFILQGDAPSGQLHTYRFLAADGHVVAEGDLSPWPPSR